MEFDAGLDLKANLERAKTEKATVEVSLRGAQSLAGRIGSIGDHQFVLTHLVGKEFYDAWIRLDAVTAVQTRVRNS